LSPLAKLRFAAAKSILRFAQMIDYPDPRPFPGVGKVTGHDREQLTKES
jgi:hypothetical protein